MKRKNLSQPAETLSQARRWETVKSAYLAAGLCDKCAAQAAWGHQTHADKWTELHPPCPSCAPIVSTFVPTPAAVWRKLKPSRMRVDRRPREESQRLWTGEGESSNAAWIGCGGCESRWTGLNSAHCAACHQTWTSVTGFDRHRRNGQCLDPSTAKNRDGTATFVVADRPWPGWSLPGTWEGPQ